MKNIKNLLSVFILFLMMTASLSAQGFLRADGKEIVNDNGPVLLRGMGLGGWLVPEAYMFNMSAFADAGWQIRAKITDVLGTENTVEFYKRFRKNYITKADIDSLKAWGFNSVRIPMHYELLTPKLQPDVFLEEGFAILDSLLGWCKSNEMYLMLDLHAAPGAQSTGGISDSDGQARLWIEPAYRTQTVALWKYIANRYKNETWIGGYDLINETAYDLGAGNVLLRQLYIDITTAIRQVDTNHLIYAEGNWYATDFSGLEPKWDTNMAYSFHKYWSTPNQSSFQYILDIRNRQNVPLWHSESGENSNSWFTDMIRVFEDNNVGWCWWTHKKLETVVGPVSFPQPAGYQTLLNYWSGNGAKPTVETAKTILFQFAENLKLEHCKINRDVLDAMMRQPFDETSRPYIYHEIPGRIYAVDYDMGNNGIAYIDKDYQKNTGSAVWNNGWIYRNDGVDIEKCTDILANTNGYNVGWTETSEWTKYTVKVKQSGLYDIKVRVATTASVKYLKVQINGSTVGGIMTVPNTGGYQSWITVTIPNITISEGSKELKVQAVAGGYNLNFIEFIYKPTAIEDINSKASQFELMQNYPNPFNPETKIRYVLPKQSNVTLTVYSVTGSRIMTLDSGIKSEGEHEIQFSAINLPSGIYYYELVAGSFRQMRKAVIIK